MSQSKKQSLIESGTNTTVGFIGSWFITLACLAVTTDPYMIATVCTVACSVWSIIRGYTIRRIFNKIQNKEVLQ